MNKLNENWIFENYIDFELKKYTLLAYLQKVSKEFDQNKLYPQLLELAQHYKIAAQIKQSKSNLFNAFPKSLSAFDPLKFKLQYEKIVKDDALMEELESIIDFSLPHFKDAIKKGKEIYDFIEKHINIETVGIVPLQGEYGYMLLKNGGSQTLAYEYQLTIFDKPDEKYRAMRTQFIRSYRRSISHTFEFIKNDLLQRNPKLPNPATYALESDLVFPLDESMMPIARRMLVRYISAAA